MFPHPSPVIGTVITKGTGKELGFNVLGYQMSLQLVRKAKRGLAMRAFVILLLMSVHKVMAKRALLVTSELTMITLDQQWHFGMGTLGMVIPS